MIASPHDGRAPVVLVVDDEPDLRALVAIALRRAGLDVREAASGEEGLAIIHQELVDLVVLDISMPGLSGLDVVRTLRQQLGTATLPVILVTGSGDQGSVLEGMDAGATDFLPKPVRLDELVARARAHLRLQETWTRHAEADLQVRGAVIAALGRLAVSGDPEEAAATVVGEVGRRTGARLAAFLQITGGGHLRPLATFTDRDDVRRGGPTPSAQEVHHLLSRARDGPWLESGAPSPGPPSAFWPGALGAVAGVPIYGADELVGVFLLGIPAERQVMSPALQARLLASAIDYGGLLSAAAGVAMRDRRQAVATRARLRRVLSAREYRPVFQPIVELAGRTAIGFEALTRFQDGTPPDVRFADATAVGLGAEFELAAIGAAVAEADRLPPNAFMTLNVSPVVVVTATASLGRLLGGVDRAVVLELTEHAAIEDYGELRRALAALGPVRIAVDDAGAGYASLRHILELEPAFAKVDVSIVRGLERDPFRQSIVAGLEYFALRTGCQLIAEGVETEAEAAALVELGIELAQGFLLGRPRPAGS